ncbi:hypothetical protein BKA01_005380 [Pseudonocardia eucalypti]|uniref:hypothetical protein n=1 Tax=Pseudonocardia eucalypti TaxID=648755 RepID=UPI0016144515|nr:hypothetical protein [Pseudonocardia eucalypti]MBB6378120.1 hypothetical protein [Pseudonocardia eucalypti]
MFTRKDPFKDLPVVTREEMFEQKNSSRRTAADDQRAQERREQEARDVGWRR